MGYCDPDEKSWKRSAVTGCETLVGRANYRSKSHRQMLMAVASKIIRVCRPHSRIFGGYVEAVHATDDKSSASSRSGNCSFRKKKRRRSACVQQHNPVPQEVPLNRPHHRPHSILFPLEQDICADNDVWNGTLSIEHTNFPNRQ